jgi:hypothetical protein
MPGFREIGRDPGELVDSCAYAIIFLSFDWGISSGNQTINELIPRGLTHLIHKISWVLHRQKVRVLHLMWGSPISNFC